MSVPRGKGPVGVARRSAFRFPHRIGAALVALTLFFTILPAAPASAQTTLKFTQSVPTELTVYEGESVKLPIVLSKAPPANCTMTVRAIVGERFTNGSFPNPKGPVAKSDDFSKPGPYGESYPCALSRTIKVVSVDDDRPEEDEKFGLMVTINKPTIEHWLVTVTIKDDDATLNVTDHSVPEGVSAKITAWMEGGFGRRASVDVVAFSRYVGDAVPDKDYEVTSTKTLTFTPTTKSHTFTLKTINDELFETLKKKVQVWFIPTVSGIKRGGGTPVTDGSRPGVASTVIILNDDTEPNVSIEGPSAAVTEGSSGPPRMRFTVKLDRPSQEPVIVSYDATDVAGETNATVDETATSGVVSDPKADYALPPKVWRLGFVTPQRVVVVEPGKTEAYIDVSINPDTLNEDDETVGIKLSHPRGAKMVPGKDTAKGVITNDDPLPFLRGLRGIAIEDDSGERDMVFYFSLGSLSGRKVTFDYKTTDGNSVTAAENAYGAWPSGSTKGTTVDTKTDADYIHLDGTVTIEPGMYSAILRVKVRGDTDDEKNESFKIDLSNITNAQLYKKGEKLLINNPLREETPFLYGIIFDDDQKKTLEYSVGITSVWEGSTGDYAAFTPEVNMPGDDAAAPKGGLPVGVEVVPSRTAYPASLDDIEHTNGEVPDIKIAEGANYGFSEVKVVDDDIDEPAEVFHLRPKEPPAGYAYLATTFDTNVSRVTIYDCERIVVSSGRV